MTTKSSYYLSSHYSVQRRRSCISCYVPAASGHTERGKRRDWHEVGNNLMVIGAEVIRSAHILYVVVVFTRGPRKDDCPVQID